MFIPGRGSGGPAVKGGEDTPTQSSGAYDQRGCLTPNDPGGGAPADPPTPPHPLVVLTLKKKIPGAGTGRGSPWAGRGSFPGGGKGEPLLLEYGEEPSSPATGGGRRRAPLLGWR